MNSKGWGFTRGSGRLPRPTFALPALDREQREFLRQIAQVRAALGEDGVKAFLAETEKRQVSRAAKMLADYIDDQIIQNLTRKGTK